MARGRPGIWSTVLGIPFLFIGSWVHNGWTLLPEIVGIPIMVFGIFIVIMGWYIHLVAEPPGPTMRQNEELIGTRVPTQKGAIARILLGLPFLAVDAGILFYTTLPYVYPTVAFVIGIFLFGKGLITYWTNTLTSYYVTTQRVIREFRLLSLGRREVPLEKVRAVEEKQSPLESLVRVGNIRVSTGGAGLEVMIKSVDNVREFADELRQLYSSENPSRDVVDGETLEYESDAVETNRSDDSPPIQSTATDARGSSNRETATAVGSDGSTTTTNRGADRDRTESAIEDDDDNPDQSSLEEQTIRTDSPDAAGSGALTNCPSCGESLHGDESFCPGCGHDLSTVCPGCGGSLDGEESFCPNCGSELI